MSTNFVEMQKSNRMVVATTTLIAVCLVTSWQYDLLTVGIQSIRNAQSKGNQSRVSRFVSLCLSNFFDGRRLGNQLFNWAAVLYVAQLTGRPTSTHYTLTTIPYAGRRHPKPIIRASKGL